MSKDTELLNYIYKNAEMGKNSISQLIDISDDTNFRNVLKSQLTEYQNIFDKSKDKMKALNHNPDSIGAIAKVSTYMSVKGNTLIDKTSSHMAQMMIQGSTMGVTDITRHLKDYDNSDPEVKGLADKLLKTEQTNIDEMKKYL
ncbi:MAG: hypothetical protein Q8865_03615 [Bacillota bacterium]|nr:hypothetical protein [Bacillota bacterium]